MNIDPHASQPILWAGAPLAEAKGAMLLLHGRGTSAQDILNLGAAIAPAGWALLAPQAAGNTWYPYSFLAPRADNEPWLESALRRVGSAAQAAQAEGLRTQDLVIAGFSQGACLATDFVGRNPQRYGALLAFTGGLIGPLNEPLTLSGNLEGTPILLSSGDPDPHVPWERVAQSGELLQEIGGRVTLKRYPGRPHTVLAEEVSSAKDMLSGSGIV